MAVGKKLLVEGEGDARVFRELAKKRQLDLTKRPDGSYAVRIEKKSMPTLIEKEFLATEAGESDLKILGIVLDADVNPQGQLANLREACRQGLGWTLPETLPAEGLILEADADRPRFGVWMMPDNSNRGMLETFLAYLVPSAGDELWLWTDQLCDQAKAKGATFKEVHRDKARIHAYLAFQHEPGRQLHEALINRLLNPDHEMARRFVDWFCRLFELTPEQASP